jgi:hypothetical protein
MKSNLGPATNACARFLVDVLRRKNPIYIAEPAVIDALADAKSVDTQSVLRVARPR